jgi:hypothetical protein
VCFDELGSSPPHLFLYLVLLFKEKDGNKKGGSASRRSRKPLIKFKYFCVF